ncbi:PA14 domain-containing protein [Hymenobacter tibetensis]|uniref:PA14 domain-containing protein n=1 Tax=Hymenobacter tibetensis TaxID=497967 RepID=A0ABY4CZV0_9BACT|nr:PA14 domain-containing protein [Hymenobacter tibetensis]UOG74504.1 PA14 domain-containing protein [Hymenobacter tibetensis]
MSVTVPSGSSATTLWLQANNLSYDDKASVRVNNSAWINLNNTTCDVAEPGKSYGGIGGGHNTLKLKIALPANTVQDGTNQISFRFNNSDGVTIGYRVIRLNFLNADGTRLMPASSFNDDNPASWQAPRPGAADVAAGEQLWRTASLNESYLPNARVLQAKCTDCHAQDGRDLKYFNYSNKSIVERAKYHGLSVQQAEQIASYIRTLTAPAPATARPWNPPYQPGPGQDSRPLVEWSAGAGIDAVLDSDSETLPYLFPNGVTLASVATTSTLNIREIPVAVQFLDWKHWLPIIHPKDAWGADFTNSKLNKMYNGQGNANTDVNLRQRIANATQEYKLGGIYAPGMQTDMANWQHERNVWLESRVQNVSWDRERAIKVSSTALWQTVKFWELMQEFDLEGLGPALYGNRSEARTWPGLVRHVFETSPQRLNIPHGRDDLAHNNKAVNNVYASNAWYHTQMVLSSGNRSANGFYPVDWGYLYGLIKDLNFASNGATELSRLLMITIKAAQQADNGLGPDRAFDGWNLARNYSPSFLVELFQEPAWQQVTPGMKKEILENFLRSWFTKSRSYPVSQYTRSTDPFDVPPANYIPVNPPPGGGNAADRVWVMIPEMRRAGVDCELLNEIADWAQQMWPNANWASLKVASCPVAGLRNPENPAHTLPGMEYSYYEGDFTALPDFSSMTPTRTGNTLVVNTVPGPNQRASDYALRFQGFIEVPVDGWYQFMITSDDGSQLFIGSQLVVDNDGRHGIEVRSGSIALKAGKHAFTVTYFDAGGDKRLSMRYSGPNFSRRDLPASILSRIDPSAPLAAKGASAMEVALYPNPTRSELNLKVPSLHASYRVLDQLGRSVLEGAAPAGTAVLNVQALPAGLYHLEITTPAGRVVRKFVKQN